MRDALSSLDQLAAFTGGKIVEADALGVFGLVSRSALEGLAGAILDGDSAAILKAIDGFDSAGKDMRRLADELLRYFRDLLVVQTLGEKTPSVQAIPDQLKTLSTQAAKIDSSRLFRICDRLADMEDKLRHVLSPRTLIEMTLLRASKIATVATVEEIVRAIRALKTSSVANASVETVRAVEPPKPSEEPPKPSEEPSKLTEDAKAAVLNDQTINALLGALPGSSIVGITEGRVK